MKFLFKKNYFFILLLLAGLALYKLQNGTLKSAILKEQTSDNNQLPFTYQYLYYTKHAKERMKCRSIDSFEVLEILEKGTVNMKKSELVADSCSMKYAIEGVSRDQQLIRVIAAPCKDKLSIVTVIDLNNEAQCN